MSQDETLVEELARILQRQHDKLIKHEILKWEKRTPAERSAWRSVARLAIEHLARPPSPASQPEALDLKPETPESQPPQSPPETPEFVTPSPST